MESLPPSAAKDAPTLPEPETEPEPPLTGWRRFKRVLLGGPKNIRDNGPSNKLPTTTVTPTLPKQGFVHPQRQTIIR